MPELRLSKSLLLNLHSLSAPVRPVFVVRRLFGLSLSNPWRYGGAAAAVARSAGTRSGS